MLRIFPRDIGGGAILADLAGSINLQFKRALKGRRGWMIGRLEKMILLYSWFNKGRGFGDHCSILLFLCGVVVLDIVEIEEFCKYAGDV